MTAAKARGALKDLANKERAAISQRFFKTGKGDYGYGDIFIGVTVPQLRKVAKDFHALPLGEGIKLLRSKIHEERLLALTVWVTQFQKGTEATRKAIVTAYLRNKQFVNNWDLVDSSAAYLVGPYLHRRSKAVLTRLAKSRSLWDRRIAILSTFYYIRQGEFAETLRIATLLLGDDEDLIHKAVGWLLREIGKRDLHTEERFLRSHYRTMPRTMLRYAVERFPEAKRHQYLKGLVRA